MSLDVVNRAPFKKYTESFSFFVMAALTLNSPWSVLEFQIRAFFVLKLKRIESGSITFPPCLKLGNWV